MAAALHRVPCCAPNDLDRRTQEISRKREQPAVAGCGMSGLAAARYHLKVAARFALLTKPKLRLGRSCPSTKQFCTVARTVRVYTAAVQARVATPQPPTRDAIKAAHNTFYAPEGVQFDALTLPSAVARALQQAGFVRPSTVQVRLYSTAIPNLYTCKPASNRARSTGFTQKSLGMCVYKVQSKCCRSSVHCCCDRSLLYRQ